MRFYDERIRRRLADGGRPDYESLIRPAGEPVHQTTRTATWRIELGPGDAPDEPAAVYVKVYRPGLRGIKFLLRPCKAWREARNLRLLARWSVPAIRAVAIGSRRSWRGLADAFLMTEEWPGGQTLARYAQRHWPIRGSGPAPFSGFRVETAGPLTDSQRADQHRIGRLLAEAVARMHRHGFYHIDLQWRNVLVRRAGDDWQIALLDCPRGGRRWTWLGRRHGQVADLASLDRLAGVYVTRAERLRWLLAYLNRDRLDRPARSLARRVMAYRDRFERRRNRRRGAMTTGATRSQVSV